MVNWYMKTACFYLQHNSTMVSWLEWRDNVWIQPRIVEVISWYPRAVSPLSLSLSMSPCLCLFFYNSHTDTHTLQSSQCCPSFIKNANRTSTQSLPATQGYPLQIPSRDTTEAPHRHTNRLRGFMVKFSQYLCIFAVNVGCRVNG